MSPAGIGREGDRSICRATLVRAFDCTTQWAWWWVTDLRSPLVAVMLPVREGGMPYGHTPHTLTGADACAPLFSRLGVLG